MKKLLFTVLVLLSTCEFIMAQGTKPQPSQQKDVRNLMWGNNVATVLKIENKLDSIEYENGVLTMIGDVLDKKALIEYDFGYNDKLISVLIYFFYDDVTGDEAIKEYDRIKRILTDKYGAVADTRNKWRSDTYRYNADKLGLALKLEHVELETLWDSNRTYILEHMKSNKDNVTIYINYVSKEYMDIKKSKERNEI